MSPATDSVALDVIDVRSPWDGGQVARVPSPRDEAVEQVVRAAVAAAAPLGALPAVARAEALQHVSQRLAERREEVAERITAEGGKPITAARLEAQRASVTFRLAAEEARRWSGALQRLDGDVGGEGRLALTRRFARGPVLAVTPFNFPVNLVAHKVAPALAVGAPVVVKPAPRTPLGALLLDELLAETDLPAGSHAVVAVGNERAAALVDDPRLPVLSFTGSGPVGHALLHRVPGKHVVLELGGNAAVVVHADADVGHAVERVVAGGFAQSGQTCISVQRVLVHRSLHDAFLDRLVTASAALPTGDPRDERTVVGPLVDDAAAERVQRWVADAVAAGARVLTGGTRDGRVVAPTVLVDVPHDQPVWRDEVFGPVVAVEPYDDVAAAFATVNDSAYGLQAGVLTRDLQLAFRAHRELEVGGVVVGDVPSYRSDAMPYGGVKGSGRGREGVLAAMHDLTVERVLVLAGLDL